MENKKREKGWFKKAKIKFIEKEVYLYELTKRCSWTGSDRVMVREGLIRSTWFGCNEAHWQIDMKNINGWAERFIWAQNLARKQPNEFYFEYKLKKDFKY